MNRKFLSNVNSKLNTFFAKINPFKKANLFLAIFLVVIIVSIVVSPDKYISVALNAILVWATNVLPALFPFMIFTRLLTATGYVEKSSRLFSPITKKLYNSPAISSYVFLMSILSGYPLGAKLTADLYSQNKITRAEAHRICCFTSNSGPMFIVGTVGVGMLVCPLAGYIILISHILSALLNGLIYRKYTTFELPNKKVFQNKKSEDVLTETMMSAVTSSLLVGGYIVIFFIITEVLSSLGTFVPFTNLLGKIGIETSLSNGIITGMFELTKGCLLVSASTASLATKTSVCALLISFGGLAISFQAFAFLNKFKISKKLFFLQKTTHAIITFVICFLLSLLFL